MERSELPAVSPNPPYPVQKPEVVPKCPSKNDEICQPDSPDFEKEDVVDWNFWLTPEALRGEGPPPPPFGRE
ncbi:hypothetical protein N7451_012895 [Penicillium sp. IBT 35674x]|nr:hypothetical protein N7451_012895 [Penicillium sp. IBT 35674x]